MMKNKEIKATGNSVDKLEGIKSTPKIEIYCKNPSCFTQYLVNHKIKSIDKNKEIKENVLKKILEKYEENKILWNSREALKEIIDLTLQEKDKEFKQKLEQLKEEILNINLNIINEVPIEKAERVAKLLDLIIDKIGELNEM